MNILTDRQTEILRLKEEGKSILEISQIFSISKSRTYQLYYKAKYKLKNKDRIIKHIKEREEKQKLKDEKKQDQLQKKELKNDKNKLKLLLELKGEGIFNDYKGEEERLRKRIG